MDSVISLFDTVSNANGELGGGQVLSSPLELPYFVTDEWQENGEFDIVLPKWREMIQDVLEKEKLPGQLTEAAETILEISSGIDSLGSDKEDFERLLCIASVLVIVLWQSYNKLEPKYGSLVWPPPKLNKAVNELVDTVHRINKLLDRKCKSVGERVLLAYSIRNLGKFKKYHRKLDFVVSSLESKPHNMKIQEIVLEVVRSRTQPRRNENTRESAEDDLPTKRVTTKKPVIQEVTAEGSGQRNAEKSTAVKPANQRVKSQGFEFESRTESKALGKKKAQNKAESDSEDESVGERSVEDKSAGKKTTSQRTEEFMAQPELKANKGGNKARRSTFDEVALDSQGKGKGITYQEPESEEKRDKRTFVGGSRTQDAAQPKTGRRRSELYDVDEESQSDVPNVEPPPLKAPLKKKRPVTTPKPRATQRSQTTPVPPRSTISGFSFNNTGEGTMINKDVGNIHNTTISDVGNDHSVNYFNGPMRKRTYA